MNNQKNQVCSRCVMDSTDTLITFDENGVCNHCLRCDREKDIVWFPNKQGADLIEKYVKEIKKSGEGKEYDCMLGLSGGVDSSYLCLKAKEMGLRPLVVHVDAGWNSELAVKNIECLIDATGFDLFTHVVDWPSMRELHRNFFKSGVPNQDIPQDHAFFAALYNYANKHKIQWVLHGGNFSTECILPRSWGYDAMDSMHIKAIHKEFKEKSIKKYPIVNILQHYFYYPFVKNMRAARFLNYMEYSKEMAIKELEKVGWRYYGGKHFESRFTKFFQSYYLVNKFGYDKRKAHLSSLVYTDQMTREEALAELEKPAWDVESLESDMEFIAKKLGFKDEEFKEICNAPPRYHEDYKRGNVYVRYIAAATSRLCKYTGRGEV